MKFLSSIKTIFIVLVCLKMINVSQADWAEISPEELEQQSDLIIVGELIEINSDVGYIKVLERLKGNFVDDIVLLRVPVATAEVVLSSTDVRFKKGQYGLWYLQLLKEGLYGIERPDRFIRMDLAIERIKSLK